MASIEKTQDIDVQTSDLHPRNIDDALVFLRNHRDAQHDAVEVKKLKRKIDLYVISFLVVCYMLNFLDKYSQVMGLSQNLHLRGNDFSNAASAFFIADLVAVVPNIFLLQRLPTARFLGFSLTAWGICTASHAALSDYTGLLTVRVLSGLFESVVPSALMLLSSQYYSRREQAARSAFWYSGMGLGQILGGLLSFAFQHVGGGAAIAGWKIMFLVLGLVTVVVGVTVGLLVPDTPMSAWFLTEGEKVAILEHVKGNQTGLASSSFVRRQVLEALLDPQFWITFVIIVLQSVGGGVITTYSALLVRSFGFTPKQAALLNMPSGVVNISSCLFCGLMSRHFSNRWLWITTTTLLAVMGASLMAFLPHTNRGGLLASTYLVNFIIGAGPTSYQWLLGNTGGVTKRAFVSASLNAAFAVGNIIGPQTFRAREAPNYESAKVALVCCWAVAVGLGVMLAAYYVSVNRHREKKNTAVDDDVSETKAFAGLTDRQNLEFRYQY